MSDPIENAEVTNTKPKKFRFGLRSLFIINFAIACVLGLVQLFSSTRTVAESLTSPGIWIGGALIMIIMSVLGDATLRPFGMMIGAVLGMIGWSLLLHLFIAVEPIDWLVAQVPMHIFAIIATFVAIVVGPVKELMKSDEPSDKDDATTQRLLETVAKMRSRPARRDKLPAIGHAIRPNDQTPFGQSELDVRTINRQDS